MARVHGKDLTILTLGGQSLLADTVSLGFKVSAKTHDVTTIGDDWVESIAGLKGGDDIDHELFYDNINTTGTWAYLSGLLGSSTALVIGDGTRTITANVVVTGLDLPIDVGEMMKVKATYKLTGAVTFS